jgi:hypothetical protein
VTPAGLRASAQAIEQIDRQHEKRLGGQRLAVEHGRFESDRARRQLDARGELEAVPVTEGRRKGRGSGARRRGWTV